MNDSVIIGHNGFMYKIVPEWEVLPSSKYPVKDCNEMLMDSNKLLYLRTNDTRNNIIIYNESSNFQNVWGYSYSKCHSEMLKVVTP